MMTSVEQQLANLGVTVLQVKTSLADQLHISAIHGVLASIIIIPIFSFLLLYLILKVNCKSTITTLISVVVAMGIIAFAVVGTLYAMISFMLPSQYIIEVNPQTNTIELLSSFNIVSDAKSTYPIITVTPK